MKAFKLMMMAGLLGLASVANAERVVVLTVADVTTEEDGAFDVVVNMDFDTQETICGWNFSITLPDGCDFNTTKTSTAAKKKCFDWEDTLEDEDVAEGGLNLQARADGGYVVAWVDADKTPLLGTHGVICTLKMKAADPAVVGMGRLFQIGVVNNLDEGWATFGNGEDIADVEFGVNQDTTGINVIEGTSTNAPVYNLNGVRVEKASKGLYIQNGKKVVVK